MGRLTGDRPSFFVRLQPWVGSLVVVLGLVQLGLAALSDQDLPPRALFTGVLIAGGGASLIAKRTQGLRTALFFAGSALTAGLVIAAVRTGA